MSPGPTMMRVYAVLKGRIMAGEFAPGQRLDPTRLATDLVTSTQPVRDALHRLYGEGLVESWQQEGFRQPWILEPAIRDLYGWSNELMRIVVHAASKQDNGDLSDPTPCDAGYVAQVEACFRSLARLSPNHEHRMAVASLNDRSALYRSAEHHVLIDAAKDVAAILLAISTKQWPAALRELDRYHHRRLRAVPQITAFLRPNTKESTV